MGVAGDDLSLTLRVTRYITFVHILEFSNESVNFKWTKSCMFS